LNVFIPLMNLSAYVLSIPFILPLTLKNTFGPYARLADQIMIGTNRASFMMILMIMEELLKILFVWLYVVIFKLHFSYGITAVVWIMACGNYPLTILKTAIEYIYCHFKIVRLKFSLWQSFGTSFIAGAIIYLISFGMKFFLADPYSGSTLEILGLMVSLVVAILSILFLYFPITTLLGGWDDDSMEKFKQGAKMSGVSKLFVWPMYKGVEFISKRSRHHNKFAILYEDATMEAIEFIKSREDNK
ncbi:MAG: hypothetical protein ACTSXU_04705, partial [Promethearchaeota archaeon]